MSRPILFLGILALTLIPVHLLSQNENIGTIREEGISLFHQAHRLLREISPETYSSIITKADSIKIKTYKKYFRKSLNVLKKIPLNAYSPSDAYYLIQIYDILGKKVSQDKLAVLVKLISQISLTNKKELAYESLGSHALLVQSATNLAISYYEKALSLQPEPKVHSHYRLFELYHYLDQKNESLEHLEAIVNHPSSFNFPDITFKAGYYLASLYYQGQTAKSIKLYKRLYPLRHMGEKAEKIVLLSRLIEDASQNLEYKNLYFYYSELSQLSDENLHRDFFFIFGFLYDPQKWKENPLLEELAFLGDNKSDQSRKAFLKAISYYYKNQVERAIGILKDILENQGWQLHALYALWNILDSPKHQHEKDYFGIIILNALFENRLYDKAKEIVPHLSAFEKYPQYHYYLGYIAKETGETNKATKHFLKHIHSISPHELTLFSIGVYFESIGDYSKAITTTDKLLEIYPHSTQYLLYLAHLYSEEKRYKIANQKLNKILEQNPVHREALYRQGLNYYYLKDVEQIQKVFKQLIEYYPQTAAYYNFLGYFLAEEKIDLPRAKTLIEKALDFEPNNEAYLDSLAWVFYQLKEYDLAKQHIDKAISMMEKKNQKDAIIYYHAGEIHHALEIMGQAKNYWGKSLVLDSLGQEENEAILRKLKQMQPSNEKKKKKIDKKGREKNDTTRKNNFEISSQ